MIKCEVLEYSPTNFVGGKYEFSFVEERLADLYNNYEVINILHSQHYIQNLNIPVYTYTVIYRVNETEDA